MPSVEAQAVAFVNSGRPELAERILRQHLAESPDCAGAHRILAHCLRVRKAYPEALAETGEALRLRPESGVAHQERGRVLREMGRSRDAETELRAAITLDPRNAGAHADLAALLGSRGDVAGSIDAARSGLAADPNGGACLHVLAMDLLLEHRTVEAQDVLAALVGSAPARAAFHNDLGVALIHGREYDAAAAELREARRLDPNNAAVATNVDVVERLLQRPLLDPYGPRFPFWWRHRPIGERVAVMALLALVGALCAAAWGLLVVLLVFESLGRRTIVNIFTRMAALAFGAAPFVLTVLAAGPTGVDAGSSAGGLNGLAALAASVPLWELLAGFTLVFSTRPAFVTRGAARRRAVGFAAASVASIAMTSLVAAFAVEWIAVALLVEGVVCVGAGFLAGPMVFRVERREWQERVVPPA